MLSRNTSSEWFCLPLGNLASRLNDSETVDNDNLFFSDWLCFDDCVIFGEFGVSIIAPLVLKSNIDVDFTALLGENSKLLCKMSVVLGDGDVSSETFDDDSMLLGDKAPTGFCDASPEYDCDVSSLVTDFPFELPEAVTVDT